MDPTVKTLGGDANVQPVIRQTVKAPPTFSWLIYLITVLVLVGVPLVGSLWGASWDTDAEIGASVLAITATVRVFLVQALIVYPLIHLCRYLYYRFWQKKAIQDEITKLQQDIQEDFFNNLVKINFKYIDKYYLQTQVQADKSFVLSCIAAIVSLLIIVVGITMMFFNKDSVTPALVTTAAGVMGELVSSVFFYLYTQTVIKMSEYHQKLVLTQNISLALKISDELAEPGKSEARGKLIEYLARDINLYLSQSSKAAKPPADKNGDAAAAAKVVEQAITKA